ncbi:MAG: YhcH/YjgK/YiaL family protein [Lachnospiraceae bacterium]
MIYDKLENIAHYLGCNKNLDFAISYILEHDIFSLPLGKTQLLDDLVYVNVMNANAQELEKQNFEIHKNYMDIQIDLSGTEMIHIGDASNMTFHDYNSQTDFAVADCATLTSCMIGPGNFILCMACEPHKPGISIGKDTVLKKCVFKIHI